MFSAVSSLVHTEHISIIHPIVFVIILHFFHKTIEHQSSHMLDIVHADRKQLDMSLKTLNFFVVLKL